MSTREDLYAALWAQIATIPSFVFASRTLQTWDSMSPSSQMPALFQIEHNEEAMFRYRLPTVTKLMPELYVYAATDKHSGTSAGTILNQLIDAVSGALLPTVTEEENTLGGMCSHCRISGKIEIDEGVLGDVAMAIIPIEILAILSTGVVSLAITPAHPSPLVGAPLTLTVVPLDGSGNALIETVTVSSDDPTIVSAVGLVLSAHKPGTTQLRVSAGGLTVLVPITAAYIGGTISAQLGGVMQAAAASTGFVGVIAQTFGGVSSLASLTQGFRNIAFFGDSVTQGRVASDIGAPGYVDLVRLAGQKFLGATRGEGIVPAYKPSRWTYTGTWTNSSTYGPYAGVTGTDAIGGARKSVVSGSTAAIQMIGDSFDIYYVTDGTTAAFTVQVDSDTPISIGGSSGSAVFAKATVAPVSGLAGHHTITIIAPASGGVIFWGVAAKAFAGSGAQVHNVSLSGSKSLDGTQGGLTSWLPTIAPDITVIAFEINDYAAQVPITTFIAQWTTLINAAKLTGTFAIIATNAQSTNLTIPQTSYVAALANLASSLGGGFYVDIFNRWGGTSAAGVALGFISGDLIHPSLPGHVDMAIAVDAAFGFPEPAARPRYGITNTPDTEYDMSVLADYGNGVGGNPGPVVEANTKLLPMNDPFWRPTFQTSVFPKGALRFLGNSSAASQGNPALRNVTKYTLFVVYQTSTAAGTQGIFMENNADAGIVQEPTQIRAICGSLTAIYGVGAHTADTNKHIVQVQYDGTQSSNATRLRMWLETGLLTMGYAGTIPAITSNASNAAWVTGQAGSFLMTGNVAHVLCYAGANALSDADAATVMAALRTKYGI